MISCYLRNNDIRFEIANYPHYFLGRGYLDNTGQTRNSVIALDISCNLRNNDIRFEIANYPHYFLGRGYLDIDLQAKKRKLA